jgi:hypothetical protein
MYVLNVKIPRKQQALKKRFTAKKTAMRSIRENKSKKEEEKDLRAKTYSTSR